MVCPVCNTENTDEAKFCKHCGASLQVATRQNKPAPRKIAIGILIVLAGVAVGICVWLALRENRRSQSFATEPSNASGEMSEPQDEPSTQSEKNPDVGYIAKTIDTERAYSVDYLWQATSRNSQSGEAPFRLVVGEGMPDGAVVGTFTDDFDGDSQDELLLAMWRDGSLCLEVHEDDGEEIGSCTVIEDAYTAIKDEEHIQLGNSFHLDVLVYDHKIYTQYSTSAIGIGNGIGWTFVEHELDNAVLRPSRKVATGGSDFSLESIGNIKQQMAGLGIPAYAFDYVDEGYDAVQFLLSPYADHIPELNIVTRVTATGDKFYAGDYQNSDAAMARNIMDSDSNAWSEPRTIGQFSITQPKQATNTKAEEPSLPVGQDGAPVQVDLDQTLKSFESQAGKEVVWSMAADYDGDQTEEMFAVTGEPYGGGVEDLWKNATLWFVSSSGEQAKVCSIEGKNLWINGLVHDPGMSGYTFLSLEPTGMGSGTVSRVFGVRDGSVHELAIPSVGEVHEEDGIIQGYVSVFDNGHQYQWHELQFDLSSFSLVDVRVLGEPTNTL